MVPGMSSIVPYDDALGLLKAANLGYPIQEPNIAFKQPGSGLWLAFNMTGDLLEPIELNGGAWQEEGTILVQIIVPTGSGSRLARTVGKQVANIYRNLGPRDVVYFQMSIGENTMDVPVGNWWVMGVTVLYRWQDVPAPAPD
jgi:hypothetical protein